MCQRLLILLLWFVLAAPLPAFAAGGPLVQVQETVEGVLQVLRDSSLGIPERQERLRTLVRARFDFPLMSQWTLGPYWRQANPAQQQRFMDLYGDQLETSYLGKIEAYTDEKVKYLSEKVDGNRAEVDTVIATRGADIPLTYKLTSKGERWQVYDVVIEGVSLVRNYRSTYGEIARKDGIEALLEQMAKKLEEQRRGKGQAK
jgi:phospholipid transport system substrate-binding protein